MMMHVFATNFFKRTVATAVNPRHDDAPAAVVLRCFENAPMRKLVQQISANNQSLCGDQHACSVNQPVAVKQHQNTKRVAKNCKAERQAIWQHTFYIFKRFQHNGYPVILRSQDYLRSQDKRANRLNG